MTKATADLPGKGGRALSLRLIGGFEAAVAGDAATFTGRKVQALIAYLALSPGTRVARETLRGLFWGESPEDRAQTSLRNAIWSIRGALAARGYDGFQADRAEIGFAPGTVATDVAEILASTEGGGALDPRLAASPKLFEDILAGFDDASEAFGDWLRDLRERLVADLRRRLEKRIEETGGARLRESASALVAIDPLHEGAVRALIRYHAEEGQTANALTVYQAFWNLLDTTFGEEPSQATQDLIVAIKQGRVGPASAQPVPAPLRPRILVERIDPGLVPEAARTPMRAFRMELVASLIRFREWDVVDLDGLGPEAAGAPADGARVCGLSFGGFTGPDGFVAALTFRDQKTGRGLWSERLANPLAGWGQTQHDIVRKLSVALNLTFSAARLDALAGAVDLSADLYDRWLRAEDHILAFTRESWDEAERQLDAMIGAAPDFGRAFSSRAGLENMRAISFPGVPISPERNLRALGFARRAVEVDPMDSRAQLAMGWSCAMSRLFDRAALAFDLAYQHNENDPWTMVSAAVGLAFCDRRDAARQLSDAARALHLNPGRPHWSYQAATAFLLGRHEDCVAASGMAREVTPDVPAWHAAALAALGDPAGARRQGARLVALVSARWVGARRCTPEDVMRWVLTCFPIRSREAWERLRDGLVTAGLPSPLLGGPAAGNA